MSNRTAPDAGPRVPALLALFLVSAGTVGFETALTRYFAVAKWSEYGYWVISIVLAGFALSGVAVALARDWFARHGNLLLAWLPAALVAAGAVGYQLATENPFNPLSLQNPVTLWPQLWLVGLYYLELLPFFFLAGLFVSLSFVLGAARVGRVYGFDLTGAGAGSLLVLGLMWLVHPFHLVPCLLLPLAAAALLARRHRVPAALAALLVLAVGEWLLLLHGHAAFNEFKAIYAPLHTPDARVVAKRLSPRGLYMLLDDFTERVDTDVSNDAAQLGFPGPPTTFGLYRDGNRIAALPRPGPIDVAYAPSTLAALPYTLLGHPRVLLAGASGGFRLAEARALGARAVTASEPEPAIRDALVRGLGPAPPLRLAPPAALSGAPPLALAGPRAFDLVDISGDFLDEQPANTYDFTADALAAYLRAVAPAGFVSIPVSIRDFPAYAIRMLATVRDALRLIGIDNAPAHVIVYRSAWNVRILASPRPITQAQIAAAKAWSNDRSFDLPYYPGSNNDKSKAEIYNDLPAVSFEQGTVVSSGDAPHDAIADEAGVTLDGFPTASARSFDLRPITLDRPAYYALLRLDDVGTILRRLELLPQSEVGPVVNLAVLAQAALLALVVLAVPMLAGTRLRANARHIASAALYFAALGLGFLFIEIVAIERASFYLDDRTSGFAVVLTAMLVFSGAGALLADRLARRAGLVLPLAVAVVVLWGAAVLAYGLPALLATLSWPWTARVALVVICMAPVSLALGLPFPLGLGRVAGLGSGFLPWAWALNGAFSVVATPLANLLVQQVGINRVLVTALLLYAIALAAFPRRIAALHRMPQCQSPSSA